MRIALAQMDPVVGSFDTNVVKIREAYERACSLRARLLLTPELGICGYPPHDLVERPEMFERNEKALQELLQLTKGQTCALIVGHVTRNPNSSGKAAQNSVSILENGKVVFTQAKTLLPTYDVFDEARYFEPAQESRIWNCDGVRIAVAICEDLWAEDPVQGRKLYGRTPVECFEKEGIDLLFSISASPYEFGKRERREKLHGAIAKKLNAPIVYVNQMGATDEVLFDGASFVLDAAGKVAGRLPVFRTALGLVEIEPGKSPRFEEPASADREDQAPEELEVLSRALVVGIKDYFTKSGFKMAILGLSGGIDSAIVATLAVKALGPKNVLGVAMPSQYSSTHSMTDAETLAANLGIPFEVRPIKFLFSTANRELAENRGTLAPLAQENLQARLRGIILMTLSNHYNALVLTTGNKSEMATGYSTMYGDMCGALAPIGDVYKTRVFELARKINELWGNPIPENTITKAPSAELRPNQKDQDTLPPYEELDALLEEYIEKAVPVAELVKRFGPWARETLKRLEMNEFKRRQAAPVLKVSHKAFGIGRRIPIAKVWET
ncbi:MAG: NAD+ synthase [Methylotenera sp.]|nr:NAD+ synthase [Oligoflexia bacterium]